MKMAVVHSTLIRHRDARYTSAVPPSAEISPISGITQAKPAQVLEKVKEEIPYKNEKYNYVISVEPKADISMIGPLLEMMSELGINNIEVKLNQHMPPSSNKEIEMQ